MNNKKGTAMVEASLIIPVIISVIIMMIYIIMGLYQLVEQNCTLHNSLLEEAKGTSAVGVFIRGIDFMKGLFD